MSENNNENEDKEVKIKEKSFLRNIVCIVLILVSLSIVLFIFLNIYHSRNINNGEDNISSEVILPQATEVKFHPDTNRIEIKKTNILSFNTAEVTQEDDYNNGRFSFILDGDYLSSFTEKDYNFKNEIYNRFSVSNNSEGKTVLTINENGIYGFKLVQENNSYYIIGDEPKKIYDNIVVLDAGHGGKDPGCQGFGLDEKDICLSIALKTQEYLNSDGYVKAYLTRSDDTFLRLGERVDIAQKLGNILVSIHINSNDRYPNISGTEVYYYNQSFDNVQYITGDECAEFLCDSISMNFGSKRRENKTESYEVIATSSIPSVLCEIGFITNKNEAEKLGSEEGIDNAAKGISKGITEIFKVIEYNKKNS